MVGADSAPGDRVVSAYFRQRRYAGAKDRNAVTETFYAVMRRRAWLEWRLANVGSAGLPDGRTLLIAQLADAGVGDDEVRALFDGSPHAPSPLTLEEQAVIQMLRRPPSGTPPPSVAGNYPGWIHDMLVRRFGSGLPGEMAALNERAPLDVRVNTLKADRNEVLDRLRSTGVDAAPTPYSPIGLRIQGNPRIEADPSFKEGFIEVQDEGSQIAAALVGARPGERVIDYCAGAGGKSLALAAVMANRGEVIACDTSPTRLRGLRPRAKRAGATSIETLVLSEAEAPAPADRVLVDAPCSGTGTWRRQPAARWGLSQEIISYYSELQDTLLSKSSHLVRPGGSLVFVTCSILDEEGGDRIEAFLDSNRHFRSQDVAELWPRFLDGPPPAAGPFLKLSPSSTDTDGFFVAVLRHEA